MQAVSRFLLTAVVATVLVACSRTVPISSLLDQPRKYADQEVTISGEVTDTFSLIVIKYFTVSDGTGSIGVLSDKPLPRKGERVTITGRVQEAFSLGDQQLTVLVERSESSSSTQR